MIDSSGMFDNLEACRRDYPKLSALAYEDSGPSRFWREFEIRDYRYVDLARTNFPNEIVPLGEYKTNSTGYRSGEFVESPDLLVAGCSQTWGVGLQEKNLWGTRLAQYLKVDSYVNIGYLGWSIDGIVTNVLRYIDKYGKPKKLALLLPDFYRVVSAYATDIVLPDGYNAKHYPDGHIQSGVEYTWLNRSLTLPKYSKRPHKIQDILPLEHSIYESVKMLQILVMYCKAAGIDLVWGSWEEDTCYLFEKVAKDISLNLDLTDYVSLSDINRVNEGQCHEELKADCPDVFYSAADDRHNRRGGHMGSHMHIHVADKFLSKFASKQIDNI